MSKASFPDCHISNVVVVVYHNLKDCNLNSNVRKIELKVLDWTINITLTDPSSDEAIRLFVLVYSY